MREPGSSPRAANKPDPHPPAPAGVLRNPRYSRSLGRGLLVLASFTSEQRARGITDIADELGFNSSTTHRYASTLQALGYLEQRSTRQYQLAPHAADLGMAALAATGLRGCTRPYLERLRAQCGHSVSLAIFYDTDVLLVDHARGFRRGHFTIDDGMAPGSQLPAASTALGKLLLAYHPDRETIVAQLQLQRTGPRAITSKRLLRGELTRSRREEITISDQELAAGVIQIAAAIHDGAGQVHAAVAITAHTLSATIQQLIKEDTEDLLACTAAITQELFGEDEHDLRVSR